MTDRVKLLNKLATEFEVMNEILYGSRMFSFNQIKKACENAGVDSKTFTAIEAELLDLYKTLNQKATAEHDCTAGPEDGCQGCDRQFDEDDWALREREDFDRRVSNHEIKWQEAQAN